MHFNREQIKDLIVGSVAVLSIFLLAGVMQEHLIKFPYPNDQTGKEEVFPDKIGLVLFPALTTWILGMLYNKRLPQRTYIPEKRSAAAGLCVFVSTITYTLAIAKTSFPVVMTIKSCNLLSVLLVAIMCSGVKEKNLKLGPKKLIVGLVITVGVLLFSFFDPEKKDRNQKSELAGIALMVVSLIADGFLPDFQAVIKSEYKPEPSEMMESINKWVTIFSLSYMLATFSAKDIFVFILSHGSFTFQLAVMSLCSFFGQVFVYRMIKQFKQHIVPFLVTVRKVLTVIISIIFYQHKTSSVQILGMVIIFGATFFEFASELGDSKRQAQNEKFEQVEVYSDQIDTERGELQESN